MKFIRYFCLLFIILSLFSCKKQDEYERIYLDENWSYSVDGKYGIYKPLLTEQLTSLATLLPSKKGYIWLKTTFNLNAIDSYDQLSLYFGTVMIADELYLNNYYLGKTGLFPPYEFPEGGKPSSFYLPQEYLNTNSTNVLLIKLWVNGYGKIGSIPFISNYLDVTTKQIQVDFFQSKIYMLCSYFILIVAAVYFFLYMLRKQEHANLSFSRLNFFSALYLVSVYYAEYSIYRHGYSFLLFEKLFHGGAAFCSTYFAISFIRDFFGRVDSKIRKIIRLSLFFVSVFLVFSARNLSEFLTMLGITYILVFIQICYAIRIIIEAIIKKDKRVVKLLIGFSPVLISLLIELISCTLFKTPFIVLIIIIGWIFTIIDFIGILVVSFVKMANKVEYVNKNLEKIVQDRTKELEYEKNRAEREIELAAFVQQSFYKQDITDFDGWDFDYYTKAMAGVSGDFFDLYKNNHKLLGFGIFDVSGHGIASGLVTMLVKNIIQQEFYSGLNDSLEDVLSLINSRIIIEKGNIENYLTGILMRINNNKIQLVNAGHPKAILYKAKTKEIFFIDENKSSQNGVIGIPDFPVIAKSIDFTVDKGDEILLYTDGITETENFEKEFFGKERLINAFAKYTGFSIRDQIESIKQELYNFSGKNSFSDDITYVILKKK